MKKLRGILPCLEHQRKGRERKTWHQFHHKFIPRTIKKKTRKGDHLDKIAIHIMTITK